MFDQVQLICFDLDDTLYPYRRFKLSGFVAVARRLSDRAGLDTPVLRRGERCAGVA